MVTTIEGENPAERSPAEKTPEQIKQEKRDILGVIVTNATRENASVQDINKWGGEVLDNIELFDPAELCAYERAGAKGLEVLARYVDLKKQSQEVRQTAGDIEHDLGLFEAEQKALNDKNGGDFGIPPSPDERENLPENESAGNDPNRINTVGKNSTP